MLDLYDEPVVRLDVRDVPFSRSLVDIYDLLELLREAIFP